MSSTTATETCVRCGHALDADAVQCDNCGEVQRPGLAGLRRAGLVKEIFADARAEAASRRDAERVPDSEVTGTAIPPAPVKRIAIHTGRITAALWLLALIAFGLAWVWDRYVLQLIEICTFLAGAGVAAVAAGAVTAAVWATLHSIEKTANSISENRQLRRQEQAKAALAQAAEMARNNVGQGLPKKVRPVLYHPPVRARKPSQWTLSFAVIGLVAGGFALLLAMVPIFGMFAFFPLVPAVCFSAVALGLSIFERSQKLLPVLGVFVVCVTMLTIGVQSIFWSVAEESYQQEKRRQRQELKQEIGEYADIIADIFPTPPPPPKIPKF